MQEINDLESVFEDISKQFYQQEFEAQVKGYNRREKEIQKEISLNDHAYFLFAFSRFEDRLRTMARELIQNKCENLISWSYKRVWRIIKKRDDNESLHFMEYVELLTEKGDKDYNTIKNYYDDRNEVAHGGYLASIDMNLVFSDFKNLYGKLTN